MRILTALTCWLLLCVALAHAADPRHIPALPTQPPPVIAAGPELDPRTSIEYTLPAGWSMLSFPVASIQAASGFPRALLSWGGSGYVAVDPIHAPQQVNTGLAYLTYCDQPATVRVLGRPGTPKPLELRAGWNLIGCPSTRSLAWRPLQLKAVGGSKATSRTVAQAASPSASPSKAWLYSKGLGRNGAPVDLLSTAATLVPGDNVWVFAWRKVSLDWYGGAHTAANQATSRASTTTAARTTNPSTTAATAATTPLVVTAPTSSAAPYAVPATSAAATSYSVPPTSAAATSYSVPATSSSPVRAASPPVPAPSPAAASSPVPSTSPATSAAAAYTRPAASAAATYPVPSTSTPSSTWPVPTSVASSGAPSVSGSAHGALSGRVESGKGAAVPGARVRLSSGQSAVTAHDGSFHIADVPPGTYSVVVTKNGRNTGRGRVTIHAGAVKSMLVTLRSTAASKAERAAAKNGRLTVEASAYTTGSKKRWPVKIEIWESNNSSHSWQQTWSTPYASRSLTASPVRLGSQYSIRVRWSSKKGKDFSTTVYRTPTSSVQTTRIYSP